MERWNDDLTQFARLLTEISGCVDIADADWRALEESMGLDGERINELFDRADAVWEKAKENV